LIPCSRIVITAGEPAGIGPDLCVLIAQQVQTAELIVIADPDLLAQRAQQLNSPLKLELADLSRPAQVTPQGTLKYLPVELAVDVQAGELNQHNADYVLTSLQIALEGCVEQHFDAVVTAPVHKGIINDAGVAFSGHTEFFAEGAGVDKVVMMLATPTLRVALATTHLPLKDVSSAVSKQSLQQVITILNNSLQQQFGLDKPRIAVCGLNPHAGEGGHLGNEEIDTINPVIEYCQQQGMAISGAWPADTVFVEDNLNQFDVVLAMYHDQGLPVLKHQGFGRAVNVTLGLPFIRTSVDHGTALDLAGTGNINIGSLQAAIDMADTMIQSRTH